MTIQQADPKAKRVLFFGFSVTEQRNGFAKLLSDRLLAEDQTLSCLICGFGGMHPPEANHLFDNLVPLGQFDVVVFDLTSTAFRLDVNFKYGPKSIEARNSFGMPIVQLLAKAFSRDAKVIFINLPRTDVDYEDDLFSTVCEKICKALNVDFINLALNFQQSMTVESLLLDEVHTNEHGSQKISSMLYDVVKNALDTKDGSDIDRGFSDLATYSSSVALTSLQPSHKSGHFRREVNFNYIEIPAGSSIDIVFPKPTHVAGISYIMGPLSGVLSLSAPNLDSRTRVDTHDAFCYYERLHATVFKKILSVDKMLCIVQETELPQITLKKGEPNLSSRVGKVCHLLTVAEYERDWTSELQGLWH